uniref:uncharacterized protein LOC118151347 n=1 Tax=Callithrix jacchus TaxID=9483 RepID=UPI00159E7B4F|nr:uncharacterized protein LOC118151347 [Callithrix jacchus]
MSRFRNQSGSCPVLVFRTEALGQRTHLGDGGEKLNLQTTVWEQSCHPVQREPVRCVLRTSEATSGKRRLPHCAWSGATPRDGPEASGLQLPECRGPDCSSPAQTWWQLRPSPGGGAAASVLSGRRRLAKGVWAGRVCRRDLRAGLGALSPWLFLVGRRDPSPRLLQGKALTSTWRDAEPSSEAPQSSEPHIPLPVVPRIRCPPPAPRPQASFPPAQPQLSALNRDLGLSWGGPGWGPQKSRDPGAFVGCVGEQTLGKGGSLQIGTTRPESGPQFPPLWLPVALQVGKRETWK